MAKPTLIYDGECGFCSRWIERWRVTTGDRVEYLTSREATLKFPSITEGELCRGGSVGRREWGAVVGCAGRFRSALRFVGECESASIPL